MFATENQTKWLWVLWFPLITLRELCYISQEDIRASTSHNWTLWLLWLSQRDLSSFFGFGFSWKQMLLSSVYSKQNENEKYCKSFKATLPTGSLETLNQKLGFVVLSICTESLNIWRLTCCNEGCMWVFTW